MVAFYWVCWAVLKPVSLGTVLPTVHTQGPCVSTGCDAYAEYLCTSVGAET